MKRTRSNARKRDPKEQMRELFEESTKGGWYTSSVPVSQNLETIDRTKPSIIKTGVHFIRLSVQEMSSMDKIKQELQYNQERGRIVSDRTFDGTQWIEFESPSSDFLNFKKHDEGIQLGGEVLRGLTGYSFRAFHQDIKPPQSAVCTVFGGRKLWIFRAPGSRDAEWLGRVASSLTLSDVQKLVKDKLKGRRF